MMLSKAVGTGAKYSIQSFCLDVLKARFPGDRDRQEIVETDDEKLNFACPFCGDSVSDSHKKRGHLYLTSNNYKCYNDGCSVWLPLAKFVSELSQKYGLTIPDFHKKSTQYRPTASSKKRGFLIELLINKEVGDQLINFKDVAFRFSLLPCKYADPEGPVGRFIAKRGIDHLPVFESSCYYDSRQDKIYLFNLDLKSGKVLGYAIRKLDDTQPGVKYKIANYSQLKEAGIIKLDDSLIKEVDALNNYFNILNIDFTKPITVVEGQIDSMFITNCIATTGVTKSKTILESLITKKNAKIFFDNDMAGKSQTIELLRKGYSVFLWSKLIHSLRHTYPDAIRIIHKIKDINDLYRFLLSRDPELTFDKFNQFVNGYYSDSPYDMIYV